MNERICALRERALASFYERDAEVERLRKESLEQAAGEPAVLREAKALAHCDQNRAAVIHEGELIVGCLPGLRFGSAPRKQNIFPRRPFRSPIPVPPHVEILFSEGMLTPAGNHTTPDYETVFAIGFRGLIERVEDRLERLSRQEPKADEKRHFLEALRIVAEGYIEFCQRHASQAREQAHGCPDAARKRELATIAENCQRVPELPPPTFWEACQCAWFAFLFLPDAPGRVDQYLYPFYRGDIERGTLTREFAQELLSCLWLKYFERVGADSGVSAINHLTLGGVKADGSDASNELTRLCLDVVEDLRIQRPQVGLRWNRHTPPDLLKRAVRVLRTHGGNPDFCNDEQIVPALVRLGIAPEDARDFTLSGCHEVIITGKAQMGSVEGFLNMPKMLRMALGLEPKLHPGADLTGIGSFDALWKVLMDVMDWVATRAHEFSLERDRREAERPGGNVAASLVVSDCIEKCKGYTQGGARYNFCNWDAIGIANLADSLVAIRKLVFEEKALTLAALVEALRANWDGHEPLRKRIVNQLPHFGNDDDSADAVAAQIVETLDQVLKWRTPFRGITAMLNSVAKLPHQLLPTSTTLNVKLDPKLLATEDGVEKVAALIQSHFLSGGQQSQFNLVTREMLLEAKRCPEKYGNLMVRVAGYSAPFTSLWEDLQEEIIARTGHGL